MGIWAYQDRKNHEKAINYKYYPNEVREYEVIRDSQTVRIKENEIVVGDIITLKAGMEIPVDCFLVEGRDIIADES